MNASENQGEGKTIDQSSFLEADRKLIAKFLAFNIVDLLDIVFESAGMDPSDQKIILPQLKHPIQYRNIPFLLLLDKSSLLEVSVSDALIDEIQQFVLAFELPVVVVGQMGHVAISAVDGLHHFSLYIFSREEAML